MLRSSNRQLAPFRFESQQSQRALNTVKNPYSNTLKATSTDVKLKMKIGQQGTENVRYAYVEEPMGNNKKVKSMSVDPPGIALSLSSSSSPASSTSATIETAGTKDFPFHGSMLPPPPPPPPPPFTGGHCHSSFPPEHGGVYPPDDSNPRGMVLASPRHPSTPPTQGSNRGITRVQPPPKLFRISSNSGRDNSIYWTPFVANRKYSDLQLQQQQQRQLQQQRQRQQHCAPYHHTYLSYPSGVPTNHPLPRPCIHPGYHCAPEVIGHPSMRTFKLKLPPDLMKLLDQIVNGCEAHAQGRPSGWRTDLYSLTQQDIALMDVPGMMEQALPILHYLSNCICEVYHANVVKVDRNQPHVLKYNQNHRGVELHHDRCDVTANLMMSRSHTYVGGGTFFPDLNQVVRLKYGEFLLHPGSLVHGGIEISKGTRYLMILFANLK